jgi:hypothetical protein
MKTQRITFAPVIFATLTALTIGCGMGTSSPSAPVALHPQLKGSAHGGQQPISGATINLYIASTNAYQDNLTSILAAPVYSNQNGNFTIDGDYTCNAGDLVYITAIGGDPGGGVNPNSALMAALGDCGTLPGIFINLNEVTTVGSVFALAPFMGGATRLGTQSSNIAGLVHAFASVRKLVNIGSGRAPGDLLPVGATAPSPIVYSLANAIAFCINSTGDTGPGSYCNTLFSEVTPTNGTLPTDTIGALLLMAQNPTLNVTTIFNNIPPAGPFVGMPAKAPNDWTLAVTYTAGGFNHPGAPVVDQSGNIWVANAGNNTVSILSQAGVPSPVLSGNGLSTPAAIAIDSSGNGWVANSTGSSVSAFTPGGGPLMGSPFAPTGLSSPVSLAFDAAGTLWVANSGNGTVSELSPTGAATGQISGLTQPSAIAINPK